MYIKLKAYKFDFLPSVRVIINPTATRLDEKQCTEIMSVVVCKISDLHCIMDNLFNSNLHYFILLFLLFCRLSFTLFFFG